MHAALVFRYTRPWAGREKLAFEAFQDALAFFEKRAADGLCQAPITYMAPSGGGMMMVHGDRDRLAEILQSEDFMHMYLRAGYAAPDLAYDLMLAGESAVNQMGIWAGVGAELGLF